MVLSTGVDRTLRLWDLTEGRVAFITRTKGEALKQAATEKASALETATRFTRRRRRGRSVLVMDELQAPL